MSPSRKPRVNAVAHRLGRRVAPQPAARSSLRPYALGPARPDSSADTHDPTGSQSYLQWGGFMAGAPGGEFGAYFPDEEPGAADTAPSGAQAIEYTWTPSRRG